MECNLHTSQKVKTTSIKHRLNNVLAKSRDSDQMARVNNEPHFCCQ